MDIKRTLTAAAGAVLAVTHLCSCSEQPLRLGTGNPGGIYYAYGTMLGALDDSAIEVKKTEGSRANMRLLNEGFLDLAIVQSDVLAEAAGGTGDFEGAPVSAVRAVAGLYYEAFQFITRTDSGITGLSDLKGKKVSVGEEGSGVSRNAEYLFLSAGIPYSSVETVHMSYAESAEALENGSIDAFLAVLGAPSTVVSELSEKADVELMSFDERTIAAMTEIYPGYFGMTIPAGTYRGQDEDIFTVGVKAVLTASSRVDSEKIKAVTALLFDNSSSIDHTVTVPGPDVDFAVEDIPCAFHKGAAEYYDNVGKSVETDPSVSQSAVMQSSGD